LCSKHLQKKQYRVAALPTAAKMFTALKKNYTRFNIA